VLSAAPNMNQYLIASERAVAGAESLCGIVTYSWCCRRRLPTIIRHLAAETKFDAHFSAAMSRAPDQKLCTSRTNVAGQIAFSSCF
jgi:hypothetical protein